MHGFNLAAIYVCSIHYPIYTSVLILAIIAEFIVIVVLIALASQHDDRTLKISPSARVNREFEFNTTYHNTNRICDKDKIQPNESMNFELSQNFKVVNKFKGVAVTIFSV